MTGVAFTLFDTAIGRTGIAWRGDVILAVQLPERDDESTLRRLAATAGLTPNEATADHAAADTDVPSAAVVEAIDAMVRLLVGEQVDLDDIEVDLSSCSPFDRSVYDVTRAIPPGGSLTYGEVAKRIGEPGAAQAVGRSLGANPVPIIVPCHRVLGAGGKLTGFSAAGGVATKRRMLLIEGCPEIAPSLFD